MPEQIKAKILPFERRRGSSNSQDKNGIRERFSAFEKSLDNTPKTHLKLVPDQQTESSQDKPEFDEKKFLNKYLELSAKILELKPKLDRQSMDLQNIDGSPADFGGYHTTREYEELLNQYEQLISKAPAGYKHIGIRQAEERKTEIDRAQLD